MWKYSHDAFSFTWGRWLPAAAIQALNQESLEELYNTVTQSKRSLSLNEELLQNISLTTVDLDMIKKSDSDLTQKDFYLVFWLYWDWNKNESPPAWLSWMQLT